MIYYKFFNIFDGVPLEVHGRHFLQNVLRPFSIDLIARQCVGLLEQKTSQQLKIPFMWYSHTILMRLGMYLNNLLITSR